MSDRLEVVATTTHTQEVAVVGPRGEQGAPGEYPDIIDTAIPPVTTASLGITSTGTTITAPSQASLALMCIAWVGASAPPTLSIGGVAMTLVNTIAVGTGAARRALLCFRDPGPALHSGLVTLSTTTGFAGGYYGAWDHGTGEDHLTDAVIDSSSILDSASLPDPANVRYSIALGTGAWLNRGNDMTLVYAVNPVPDAYFEVARLDAGTESVWTQPDDAALVHGLFVVHGLQTNHEGQMLKVVNGTPAWAPMWVQLTQAQYTALPVKDPYTLYVIVG
jgi:hypothetical protein